MGLMPHPVTIMIGVVLMTLLNNPLPIGIPWSDFEVSKLREVHPAMWERIDAARSSTPDEIRDMLRSDNPETVSLGIDAANFQCRPDLLLEAKWLVEDPRVGLPRLVMEGRHGRIVPQYTPTLGEDYQMWLTHWVASLPREPQALHAALENPPDPWLTVSAWRVRLERLALTERRDELLDARRHLRGQPETLQWIVATMPQPDPEAYPTLTEDDIRAILSSLSPETKRRIADRTIELPPDIAPLRERNPQYLESFFTRYEHAVAALD